VFRTSSVRSGGGDGVVREFGVALDDALDGLVISSAETTGRAWPACSSRWTKRRWRRVGTVRVLSSRMPSSVDIGVNVNGTSSTRFCRVDELDCNSNLVPC
jgi:hypothetical protein